MFRIMTTLNDIAKNYTDIIQQISYQYQFHILVLFYLKIKKSNNHKKQKAKQKRPRKSFHTFILIYD